MEEDFFLFLDEGFEEGSEYDEFAYLIIPADHPDFHPEIHSALTFAHQYGCVANCQFMMRGRVEKITDKRKVSALREVLGCTLYRKGAAPDHSFRLQELKEMGLDINHIEDEALARLADGRYIAINNCD